tara:strand:+ start:120 stop:662 length:543 start_codon:yes stop_codon:yes gene_type:complete
MSLGRTGDRQIVMYLDGVDADGKTTYQHIYEHKDGRKAYVGPGYCSDPDLEWILFQNERKIKVWNIKHAKKEKICLYTISAAWLTIIMQGAANISENGALVLLSVLGYWITEIGSLGFFNNFKDLAIRKRNDQLEQKIIHLLIVSCFIYLGQILVGLGKFNHLSIFILKIHSLGLAVSWE